MDAPLQLDIFLAYMLTVAAILVTAVMILGFIALFLRQQTRPLWIIYTSWCVIIAVTFGALYLGRIPTIIYFTLLSILAFKEYARATGLYHDWWMTGACYLAILATGITTIVPNPNNGVPGWYGLYMVLPAYAIALFVVIPILRNRTHGQIQTIALAILGYVYIGWMFLHLALFTDGPNVMGYLLYLLVAVELNDVAAYTFGRLFGKGRKHPLRSEISPNKTWEGAIGALLVSMILPWLLRFSFPHFGITQLILTGLIIGIGGQMGDLSISMIKRDLGIKDMGRLIPGHGGVLDRLDSLIYTAPLFLHMIDYYYKHW